MGGDATQPFPDGRGEANHDSQNVKIISWLRVGREEARNSIAPIPTISHPRSCRANEPGSHAAHAGGVNYMPRFITTGCSPE